jgi:RNA polymerase sigma-70 factor (ECF subfamily)
MAAIVRRDAAYPPAEDDDFAGNADATLVQRAKADIHAFELLYGRYYPIVYGFCLRRLADHDLAEDATAQTFTRCIAALPKFSPNPKREGSSFRSWLFTIARNVVIDQGRRTRHHASIDQAVPIPMHDPEPTPEDQAISRDEALRVRTMLARLPERQRSIVELRLAGLTGTEIAASLHTSLSAVKSAQTRAYVTLRALLDDPGAST